MPQYTEPNLYASFDQNLFGLQQLVPKTNGVGTNTVLFQTPSTTLFTKLNYTPNTPTKIPGLDAYYPTEWDIIAISKIRCLPPISNK